LKMIGCSFNQILNLFECNKNEMNIHNVIRVIWSRSYESEIICRI
jgi:hypothetical protein